MAADDKPAPTGPPASGVAEADLRDKSSPSLDEVDSAWSDEEELDEDATMVAKVPLDLVALSRRGTDLEKKPEPEPEKHEAITARPPPQPGEASVVVDAPHQNLPQLAVPSGAPAPAAAPVDDDEDEELEEEEEEQELAADDLDAGWDIEEERAAAADVAAGLDAEARTKAAEARAAQRKEKSRSKKLAAKEKRKARADSIRAKQKKPKKRSMPPPRPATPAKAAPSSPPPRGRADGSTSREYPTIPPKEARAALAARRDLIRMVLFVAIVVVVGALAIGLARR